MDEDACDQCGSREFYVQDGRTYCGNGHDQNRGAEVGDDEDDYGTQGRRINTRERTKKQKTPKVYIGKKAYRLFLQAYQHILWKQCYALVHVKGFPAELWLLVKDLWSLRLSKLLSKLEDPLKRDDSDTQGPSIEQDSQEESVGESEMQTTQTARSSPSLIDTICLCYMAMLLMRLPVSLGQVFQWIGGEDVPYIRAIRHVPEDMKDKLPGEYHAALDTSTILRPELLQTAVLNLCSLYARSYGMDISPLNMPPMLYDYVKDLSLPLEVYALAKSLNNITKFDFKYVDLGGRSRRTALSYPEAQLMSLVVVASKLLFPFNNDVLQRHARSAAEEPVLSIDWKLWADTRKKGEHDQQSRRCFDNGKEIYVNDTDVFSMSAQQLDHYMNWYQRTWIRRKINDDDVIKELLDMFPVGHLSDNHVDPGKALREEEIRFEHVKAVQASLKTSNIITEEEADEISEPVMRPGMHYQQFRNPEALNLSVNARIFHHEAAKLSCLSLDMLLRAVLKTERKITLWRRAKRRAEKYEGEIDLEAEEATLPGLVLLDRLTLAEATGDPQGEYLETHEDDLDSQDTDANI